MHHTIVCQGPNLNKHVDTCIACIQVTASELDLGFAQLQHSQIATPSISEPVQNLVPNGISAEKEEGNGMSHGDPLPPPQPQDVSMPDIVQLQMPHQSVRNRNCRRMMVMLYTQPRSETRPVPVEPPMSRRFQLYHYVIAGQQGKQNDPYHQQPNVFNFNSESESFQSTYHPSSR